MACYYPRDEYSKTSRDNIKYAEVYECEFDEEDDIIYDSDCSEEKDKRSTGESDIGRVFVDGNEADYEACEDEDTLLERVWRLSKPPKIPRHTSVVSARRIQVMKERLLSTINALPNLSECTHDEGVKNSKRKKVKSDVEYVEVNLFDEKNMGSCQQKSGKIVPNCAQLLDELL